MIIRYEFAILEFHIIKTSSLKSLMLVQYFLSAMAVGRLLNTINLKLILHCNILIRYPSMLLPRVIMILYIFVIKTKFSHVFSFFLKKKENYLTKI